MRCLVCVLFLKIIVCKDDEILAFSAMMKMGLHLTYWLREQNYFLIIWSSGVKYVSHDVSWRFAVFDWLADVLRTSRFDFRVCVVNLDFTSRVLIRLDVAQRGVTSR